MFELCAGISDSVAVRPRGRSLNCTGTIVNRAAQFPPATLARLIGQSLTDTNTFIDDLKGSLPRLVPASIHGARQLPPCPPPRGPLWPALPYPSEYGRWVFCVESTMGLLPGCLWEDARLPTEGCGRHAAGLAGGAVTSLEGNNAVESDILKADAITIPLSLAVLAWVLRRRAAHAPPPPSMCGCCLLPCIVRGSPGLVLATCKRSELGR